MTRARVLAQARAASAPAPVSVVAYTATEIAERQAYAELAALARRWRKRNLAERVLRALEAGESGAHEPFLLTRRLAAATHPLVRYAKTLTGLRPTVVHIHSNSKQRE